MVQCRRRRLGGGGIREDPWGYSTGKEMSGGGIGALVAVAFVVAADFSD